MSQVISLESLKKLAADKLAAGAKVVAPVEDAGLISYRELESADQAVLAPHVRVQNSIKEFFFPRHETIFTFVRKGKDVEIANPPAFDCEQIVLGARPCDAAGLPILDPLFAWDYQDQFYQSRRAKSTVVSFACKETDAHCFCYAVGGGPDNTDGADAVLFDLGNGKFEVRTITEKGKALFAGKTTESKEQGAACAPPQAPFDLPKVIEWIGGNFNSDVWEKVALRCVGCGACAYVCPTCHCFDIVDEGSYKKGGRVKNWDSCQMAMFTLHASGHNPRGTQGKRQRQRLTHKFVVYPEKFGKILCTGCGNCSRSCAASVGVRATLEELDKVGVKKQN
ncbi:MAG: 4Fe-4S dicluster domain-containing protein [Thermoguttaceae bacterium]|nr:4Fe-4S dicluster domain-containing protein [Thermoguttaceae bacterium]